MKRINQLLVMVLGINLTSFAQQPPLSHCDINNINATIMGHGCCYDARMGSSCTSWEVPRGSGLNTVFQYSLWFGGLDEIDSLHISALQFAQQGEDYWSGPLKTSDASTDRMTVMKYHHVWNLTRAEIEEFKANYNKNGYVIPEDILSWPAHGDVGYAEKLAPFVDVDGDGRYNPENGDYPDIKGDQCLFFIFNDGFKEHTESLGNAVGLEVHAMVYAFDMPDNEVLNNTVFMNYKIINRSSNRYNEAFLALFLDWDIGYAYDDYVGCDVRRSSCFAYNGDDVDGEGDEGTYGDNPPLQVCTILAGPTVDADGRDNPAFSGDCESLFYSGYPLDRYAYNGFNFGNGIADDERYGMCSFVYFQNVYSELGNPQNALQHYNYLRGLWKNGQPMQYGGDAFNNVVGPECKFMFPGDSDPCNFGTYGIAPNDGYNTNGIYWTEDESENSPGDRRGLAATGPCTFASGQTQELDFAFITVWKNESQTVFERKGEMIDQVRSFFINGIQK